MDQCIFYIFPMGFWRELSFYIICGTVDFLTDVMFKKTYIKWQLHQNSDLNQRSRKNLKEKVQFYFTQNLVLFSAAAPWEILEFHLPSLPVLPCSLLLPLKPKLNNWWCLHDNEPNDCNAIVDVDLKWSEKTRINNSIML